MNLNVNNTPGIKFNKPLKFKETQKPAEPQGDKLVRSLANDDLLMLNDSIELLMEHEGKAQDEILLGLASSPRFLQGSMRKLGQFVVNNLDNAERINELLDNIKFEIDLRELE